ncbi:MAG TPA: TlpA disulfide reductase family protein [Bryobacteraceae bacterium]|nr:TlpA disulfide reductase family protein [Bryobacteraceae bacterium]
MNRFPVRKLAACAALLIALAASLAAANIPRKAPSFTIALTDGKQVSLAQFQGKVVALAFILTTCPHCQAAVKCLSGLQGEFGPRGFQALASAVEDTAKADVPGFLKQFQPPFPVGYSPLRPVLDFMQHPPMVGPKMPLIAFIDRQGVIQAQYEGYEPFLEQDRMAANIRAKVMDLLGIKDSAVKKSGARKASGTASPEKK